MALYEKNGVWILGTQKAYIGKTLPWMVTNHSNWVIEHLVPMCRTQEECDAIDAEMALQAGPRTFVMGCPVCGHTTTHTAAGCTQCAAYKEEAGA